MLSDLGSRLRALIHRGRLNAELDEELCDHIEHEAEKSVRSGMPAEVRVLSFTVATMLLTSILTGMMPALSSSRVNLTNFFKSGGHGGTVAGRNRLRSSLIVSEVAIVVVLLAGAGLLLRSHIKLELSLPDSRRPRFR